MPTANFKYVSALGMPGFLPAKVNRSREIERSGISGVLFVQRLLSLSKYCTANGNMLNPSAKT
jgi:hypothetical protein